MSLEAKGSNPEQSSPPSSPDNQVGEEDAKPQLKCFFFSLMAFDLKQKRKFTRRVLEPSPSV